MPLLSPLTPPQEHRHMPNSPDMALRLPPHIQKQLADMASSPPPRTRTDAPANSQYHTALAIQYRQRIQGIMKADLSAFITADDNDDDDDVTDDQISPLPSKRHDTPSSEVEDLPPYSEEDPDVNTTACTITVKELSSMDTPTPTPTSADCDNRFFALVTATTHESTSTRPHTDMITRHHHHNHHVHDANSPKSRIGPTCDRPVDKAKKKEKTPGSPTGHGASGVRSRRLDTELESLRIRSMHELLHYWQGRTDGPLVDFPTNREREKDSRRRSWAQHLQQRG
ncbi:uncharacterized protein IWZ02DRAFT_15382 [Phyllosticta citriasiana]|uniref:uncharacterized protein n=1 Tax=Phyllosticta citriasiana TaxID=595635 RepID=UPI0030FD8C8A